MGLGGCIVDRVGVLWVGWILMGVVEKTGVSHKQVRVTQYPRADPVFISGWVYCGSGCILGGALWKRLDSVKNR